MEPRHAELTRSLLKAMTDGTYPVGALLPGELEIAEQYGISRGTVRRALGGLAEMGIVSRKKRAGTRVEAVRPEGAYSSRLSTVEELAQYGAETYRTVHATREIVLDRALAERLGCAPGERWLHIATTRAASDKSGKPLSWADNYVTVADGRKIRRQLSGSQELISELIGKATGRVTKEVRQEIRAVSLRPEIAAILGAEAGSPALEFRRHYIDQSDRLFEIVVSTHPADRMVYQTTLRRG
jgi:GntR family transcriptional regulator